MSSSVIEAPYYREVGREREVFASAYRQRLPLLLKGPTGCGKSRFVEAMAAELGRPLVTVACNEDTSATDLLGRYLVESGDTVWCDGPATRAAREGAILYLDEIAEARDDVLVVLHPLGDHRRELYLDRKDELVRAADGFLLVASFNPGYQRGFKELKPSTRQRFVTLRFAYPEMAVETEIVATESGIDAKQARRLVAFATKIRGLDELGLVETVSTRLLIGAARLMRAGLPARLACEVGIVEALTDDIELCTTLRDAVALAF